MSSEDRICCFVSWNIFIRGIIFLPIIGIIFDIYKFDKITLVQLGSAIGAVIGLYLLHERNKQLEKQSKTQYEIFMGNSEFENFLEATKLLTDKEATTEAKVSAMYLLYDTAKKHPQNIERIAKILSVYLSSFMKQIDEGKIKFDDDTKKILNHIHYKGNDKGKIVGTALYIMKKIALLDEILDIDLNYNILYDISSKDYNEYLQKNLKLHKKPIRNLVFLYCVFDNCKFSKIEFYYCRFLYCNFVNAKFYKCNLWGSSFIDCDLKGTNFDDTECEGVEFKNCLNFEENQIKKMKFKNINKNNSPKYLIIYDNKKIDCFKTEDEYKVWKKRQRSENVQNQN